MAIDQYGQIIRRTPHPIPIHTNPNVGTYYNAGSTTSARTVSYRNSWWRRFDNFIGSIGNWFANNSENITSTLATILLASGGISFIVWLFSLGLLWGIIAGIFLGGIVYYALIFVVGVFVIIGNIVLGIIRYVFYSGTTFLIALAIIGIGIGFSNYSASTTNVASSPIQIEYTEPATTKYYCTARTVLNVRYAPNTNSKVIGKIKHNQIVEVYEITNGFAKIKFNSDVGYASANYLHKYE